MILNLGPIQLTLTWRVKLNTKAFSKHWNSTWVFYFCYISQTFAIFLICYLIPFNYIFMAISKFLQYLVNDVYVNTYRAFSQKINTTIWIYPLTWVSCVGAGYVSCWDHVEMLLCAAWHQMVFSCKQLVVQFKCVFFISIVGRMQSVNQRSVHMVDPRQKDDSLYNWFDI